MKWLMAKTIDFIKEEDGVTAIEYGLIAAFISVMIIGGITVGQPAIESIFDKIGDALVDGNAKSGTGG
ncbi:Flp family type IVb pilin [Desulfosediminicola flagellatus]|uniref:Flp family type IVb pilin n=1 Tax=Desulfosediminicola flagellatus TaxID=2569541 RepID=UPI0010ABC5F8|nr:Flp family type IVb pilin [Desulfosediminicola flagellatus]